MSLEDMEELWLDSSLDRQWCIDVVNGRHHRCLFHGLKKGPLFEVTGLSSRILGLGNLRHWRYVAPFVNWSHFCLRFALIEGPS